MAIQEEIEQPHCDNPVLINFLLDIILYDKHFPKIVTDIDEGTPFLFFLGFIRHLESRLDIKTVSSIIDYEIMFLSPKSQK